MEQTTLSKYVKAMRKQYNLTQVELSEKSGVDELKKEFDCRIDNYNDLKEHKLNVK